jgi:hypothetical protein
MNETTITVTIDGATSKNKHYGRGYYGSAVIPGEFPFTVKWRLENYRNNKQLGRLIGECEAANEADGWDSNPIEDAQYLATHFRVMTDPPRKKLGNLADPIRVAVIAAVEQRAKEEHDGWLAARDAEPEVDIKDVLGEGDSVSMEEILGGGQA